MRTRALALALLLLPMACGSGDDVASRAAELPTMRWDAHRPAEQAERWTRATLAALDSHGADLVTIVPADIANYCPAYPEASEADRRAFWAGLFSSLAKHESTWNPQAVGGGGLWFGLVQIAPATARGYGCAAKTGEDLKQGEKNLSCAVRIAAHTVARDGVVSAGGRGIAADWGPFHSSAKRADIAEWTRAQSYCQPG
ncbi:lytic transglycosylase domain-containing protein [Actibacterium sp. XHP0104]|uniref:lytic transglycosylase domain-containing protein n=1 Tax=Actibacterium sp. XHP0104 TaxID=2984335 RepID=UPI0021E8789C|nr:lytic transglycosylase domain-containing protein [Actibacterium sp. XHP0104]MCV2881355.1 lytic transglycosylase domain-containing protein [Actibacterium sp. XHP0104]